VIDPSNLSVEELRERLAQMQAEQERTTPGWSERECDGYAACRDVLCDGNSQQKVRLIRTQHTVTFGEHGDPQGPYASTISHDHVYLRFADPADAICPTCGLDNRDVSEQLRPSYVNIVGSQDALLRVRKAGIAGPPDAQAVVIAAEQAKTQPESPIEALQRRYVNGEIEDAEYAQKLGVLGQPIPALLRPAPKPKPPAAKAA
jgi:hypothetical protein